VYLYCSLAGGTGSGAFLPIGYLIQDILMAQGWQPRVIGNFVLSTMLTGKVAPDLHPNIHANTYAGLKELEHLAKMNYQSVRLERPKGEPFVFWNNENSDEIPHVHRSALFHSFLFDRPSETDIKDLEETLADASFLQVFTPIISSVAGEYDNYEQHNQSLTTFAGEHKNIGQGYTKNYGAFGTAALVLPASELLEYSASRFAAEALRRQITFAATGQTEGQERTLDRLRVPYDDPAFRNLEEGSRFDRINESFLLSVQAMADFDAKAGQTGGYWFRLVEDVDKGKLSGLDKDGKELRTETLIQRVLRKLDEDRKPVADQVQIKNRAFVFQREGVNQYTDLLNRFKDDIQTSTLKVEQGKEKLKASSAEGEAIEILDPKPTPMQERYLVIQLLKLLDTKLLSEAKDTLDKARLKSFANPSVQERLEREIPGELSEAANRKGRFGIGHDQEGFEGVRNGAQTEFQGVAHAHARFLDADLRLAQYRSLRDYLASRARQYAMLATRINDLVNELEAEAESLRSGVAPREPRLALSVEIFETLDQPRRRIWDQVYDYLFIRDGKDMSTFDRQTVATGIGEQLAPVKDPQTGRFVPKGEFTLIADLKRAMMELGRDRLRKTIYGDQEQRGLTLESGLEIEARLKLPQTPGRPLEREQILNYMAEKFKAVHLMSSLIARTATEEMRSLDDGVKLANKRHICIRRDILSPTFFEAFRRTMEIAPRQISVEDEKKGYANPHIALVHDCEVPIPLYYFRAVTGEIEESYHKVMENERRAFQLHIDYNWEHSLPDLNPRKAEIGVTWSLEVLLDGLLAGVFVNNNGKWVWQRGEGRDEMLGDNLAAAMYAIGGLYEDDILRERLNKAIREQRETHGAAEMLVRAETFRVDIGNVLEDIAVRARNHEKTREDELEMPILRAMLRLLDKRLGSSTTAASTAAKPAAPASASLGRSRS
jgi:hypothetical protein